jgi:predicted nucleic acid-binding protein
LASPSLVLLSEPDGFWKEFERLLEGARVSGGQVHDARIAALCIVHRVRELWTADRDFGRFSGLKTRNPLVAR